MKISPIKNASNIPIIRRIKNMFVNCKLKIQTLTKDVFERQKIQTLTKDVFERQRSKYIIVDGKKYRARDWSNCAGRPNDYLGVVADKIKYYPEDEAILKTMKTARERIEYKKKLHKAGRYTIEEAQENNK